MENRFGLKDLIHTVLLLVLIVSVWLSMKQRDREWTALREIAQQGQEQTRDLSSIRRLLQTQPRVAVAAPGNGGVGSTATTQSAGVGEKADPFRYVREAQAKPDYALGDWFVDNFGTKVPRLTPLVAQDAYQAVVEARTLEGLAYQDPNTLELLPLLARDWQVKDNSKAWNEFVAAQEKQGRKRDEVLADPKSPPALEITFQLREGVTFSDGTPFSADDVVWTYEWIMNPKVQAPRHRAFLDKISRIEKKGDHEVVFHFREPYFEALDLAASMMVMPKHFYSKYTPEVFNESTGLLMGTGPYRLTDPTAWKPGDQIELVRNERYWGEPGPWDKIIYHQVESDAADLTMFKNGETDYFAATPEQYKLMLDDRSLAERTQHYEVESALSGYAYVAWNQRRGGQSTIFADKRVRQAMTLLTDRQRICDEVMLGFATVATGPFSRVGKPQTHPDLKPWPFDPEQAKKLLAAAGFQDRNGDGLLEDGAGKPFSFKLTYPSGSETYERVVLFLKDTYARAGVRCDLDPVDWPIMIKKLQDRDFDAITLRWTGGAETDIYQMFHSSQTKDNGDNMMSYISPELDRLLEQARSTVDEAARMPLWQKASLVLHEDQPYTFLFNSKALVWMDARIRNVGQSKLGLNYMGRLNMPIPWYVPKAQQKWTK